VLNGYYRPVVSNTWTRVFHGEMETNKLLFYVKLKKV